MLELTSVDLKTAELEALVVPVCADKAVHSDGVVTALVRKANKIRGFSGEKDDLLTLHGMDGVQAERVVFVGLGKAADLTAESLRVCAGRAVKTGRQTGLNQIAMAAPAAKKVGMGVEIVISALLEGLYLANHDFYNYKKEKKNPPLKELKVLSAATTAKRHQKLARRTTQVCAGTLLAREWVNLPPNDKPPARLAAIFSEHARREKLKVRILEEEELRREGFGAMLAVGTGSRERPRLVIMEYAPKNARRTVALVGKGVIFDSGGINLKPTGHIEDMKTDMAGAAAVAATMIAVAGLKPKIRVIGAMPLVENMPSAGAYRPGDIYTSYEGKTVEIGNTDAEGRLILIDAMAYVAKHYAPEIMLDTATLTGACVVALGEKLAGVFSNDDELAAQIVACGQRTHERCWQLPMPEDYRKLLKSDYADLKNVGSTRWGGAITAALFLSEFVKGCRWAHIDIAGPASSEKAGPYCPVGGTGFGVRLFSDWLQNL